MRLDELGVAPPPISEADWNREGVVILRKFLPDDLMDAYEAEWLHEHAYNDMADDGACVISEPGGWNYATPYMEHPALRALATYLPLSNAIEDLIGEPPGLHLCLTGWVSTERNWHQDGYLNPAHVGDSYAAVWIALEDIDPASGPFQYVPGSHRWPQVTQQAIGRFVDLGSPQWPKRSEMLLNDVFEAEIKERRADVVTYVPRRGDCAIWHPRLLHRGSTPQVPGLERRALICHYSGVKTRKDFPARAVTDVQSGGMYFPIRSEVPIR